MDLEEELLAVLDNPSEVWSAVMTHLSLDSRTILHVFTTCSTPASLVDWQSATARVSTEAAVGFEAALRSLDDTFVSLNKPKRGAIEARYRNPSMDDFCAEHLDRNAGFATTVANNRPSLDQARRLIQLATSRQTNGRIKYQSLHEALIANPSTLLNRLLDLREESDRFDADLIDDILRLVGSAPRVARRDVERARTSIGAPLAALRFNTGQRLNTFTILDSPNLVVGLKRVLGDDAFAVMYRELWQSADALSHFDSMVNVDEALDINGREAEWRDYFESLNDKWDPEAPLAAVDDVDSSRTFYTKVVEHLDFMDVNFIAEWDQLVADEEAREEERQARLDQQDDDWQPSEFEPVNQSAPFTGLSDVLRQDPIDSMFSGLVSSDREVDEG